MKKPNQQEKPGTGLRVNQGRILVMLAGVIALIAVGTVMKFAQGVFLPLIIAWLLSYMFGPVVRFLAARKIPAGVSVVVVLLLLLGVCYLAAVFLNGRIGAFADAFPRYHERLTQLQQQVVKALDIPGDPFQGIDWGARIGKFVVGLSQSLVGFMSKLVTVLIFLVFMLLGKPYFQYKIERAFTPGQGQRVNRVLGSISSQIGRYLAAQFLISLITGVLVWAALVMLKIDFPVTWGATAFLLNFIPTVGSIVASIPPILLALVQYYPHYWPAILTTICLLSIQMVMGNVITPKVMGDRLNLSPVVILLSLLFWGWLWGVVGALLSIPITCAIKITCENIEPLRIISIFMGSGKTYKKREKSQQSST